MDVDKRPLHHEFVRNLREIDKILAHLGDGGLIYSSRFVGGHGAGAQTRNLIMTSVIFEGTAYDIIQNDLSKEYVARIRQLQARNTHLVGLSQMSVAIKVL